MELKNDIKTFYAKDRKAWRRWLEKNHKKENNIWLIIYKKSSQTKSVYYNEAVEEALCFGWIDSKPNKRDEDSFYQFFAKRNPKSNWSLINKNKVEKLIKAGLMTDAGLQTIEAAKQNGTWTALDEVDNSIMPDDLKKVFDKNKTALKNFDAFPISSKKIILEWIHNAKKEETRKKRIEETVSLAAKNIRANHYRQ